MNKKDDFLQPTNPRFEKVYGHNPIREAKEERRKKENWKDDREVGLRIKAKKGLLKPWEVKSAIRYARENNLE